MKLNGKSGDTIIFQALAGAVVQIVKTGADPIRQGRGGYSVTMVLAGDIDPAGGNILYRLICASVAVFQLFRPGAVGKGKELMAQADAENRHTGTTKLL